MRSAAAACLEAALEQEGFLALQQTAAAATAAAAAAGAPAAGAFKGSAAERKERAYLRAAWLLQLFEFAAAAAPRALSGIRNNPDEDCSLCAAAAAAAAAAVAPQPPAAAVAATLRLAAAAALCMRFPCRWGEPLSP